MLKKLLGEQFHLMLYLACTVCCKNQMVHTVCFQVGWFQDSCYGSTVKCVLQNHDLNACHWRTMLFVSGEGHPWNLGEVRPS